MARSSFLLRRTANRLLRDPLDWVWRRATGRGHLPPYSMRQFIGGAAGFEAAGAWFAQELQRLDLLPPGARLLDLGCGCGRLALGLMRDPALQSQDLRYWGLDVDPRAIGWCRRHITVAHPNFAFIHADVRNDSYHPAGASTVVEYALPLPDSSLDLVVATSLFTHLQTAELSRYHREAARVLAPGGRLYASYFLFESWEEAARECRTGRCGSPTAWIRSRRQCAPKPPRTPSPTTVRSCRIYGATAAWKLKPGPCSASKTSSSCARSNPQAVPTSTDPGRTSVRPYGAPTGRITGWLSTPSIVMIKPRSPAAVAGSSTKFTWLAVISPGA
jgi:SAM-dependent methyltransferase